MKYEKEIPRRVLILVAFLLATSTFKSTIFAATTLASTMASIAGSHATIAQETSEQESGSPKTEAPSVGVPGEIEQLLLPGTLLTHENVDPSETDLVVRIIRSFPHGDSFRYDISYYGMESGDYDLSKYLVREDGSSTDDLPAIPVTIKSIINPGQIQPNDLDIGMFGRVGGYKQMVIIGVIIWVAVLLAMIFMGRRKKDIKVEQVSQKLSLADRLRPSIEAAINGELPAEKHAELERMLFAFWQKRLSLIDAEPSAAINQIRNNQESGPLMKQVEQWLHSPTSDSNVDIAELLRPYQKYAAEEIAELTELDGLPKRDVRRDEIAAKGDAVEKGANP